VETKNISFILVSKYKLLLSREPLPFIFDYLPSAYLIVHNCGTTWRFWLSNSVVPTFVRTVKHFDIFHYKYINPTPYCFKNPHQRTSTYYIIRENEKEIKYSATMDSLACLLFYYTIAVLVTNFRIIELSEYNIMNHNTRTLSFLFLLFIYFLFLEQTYIIREVT